MGVHAAAGLIIGFCAVGIVTLTLIFRRGGSID